MKKSLRKVIGLFSVCLFACVPTSCGQTPVLEAIPQNEMTISAFDDYYDVQKIDWNGVIGTVKLCSEPEYVKSGKSAELHIKYDGDAPYEYNDHGNGGTLYSKNRRPTMTFNTFLYDSEVVNTDYVEAFRIDVYNANDRAVDLIFAAIDDGGKVLCTDGRTLIENGWNDISFDMKPYFFDGKGISKFNLYIFDREQHEADDLTLYFDNCRVVTNKNRIAPQKSFEDNEILSFNGAGDLAFISASTATTGYPAFFAKWSDRTLFGQEKGAMHVVAYSGIGYQYDVNASNNGYDLTVLPSIASRAGGSKISIDCKNESAGDVFVRLIASSGSRSAESVTCIRAAASGTVVLDLEDFGSVDGLKIKIDNWNMKGRYDLYFGNLITLD